MVGLIVCYHMMWDIPHTLGSNFLIWSAVTSFRFAEVIILNAGLPLGGTEHLKMNAVIQGMSAVVTIGAVHLIHLCSGWWWTCLLLGHDSGAHEIC